MKKLMFWSAIALATLALFSCKEKGDGPDLDNAVEDGFYVAGEATGVKDLAPAYMMTAGVNESLMDAEKKTWAEAKRAGMYEKYIVLEANKEFDLKLYEAGKMTRYSATLSEFTPPAESDVYGDDPKMAILKGVLETGDAAPAMKVSATGLYHIVLDLNTAGDLDNAQIIVAPVEWGVRGAMNGWGFTKMTAANKEDGSIVYTIAGVDIPKNGEFKFAYGGAWKITLDNAKKVRAHTNLGNVEKEKAAGPLQNGGENIKVEKHGLYDITLTYKLAAGEIGKSYSYTLELKEEVEDTAPEHMYMNGGQWGGAMWDWNADTIVELVPVFGAPGYFWVTRWFDHNEGFKFAPEKAWGSDFGIGDQNCQVEADGFYTIFVNGNDKIVEIMPAEVYVIGATATANEDKAGCWDFDGADVLKFQADGQVLTATLADNGELRLASKVTPSAAIDGVTTGNGWIDWWKTEFIFFEDGKIEYRGAGGDQARVQIEAGQKITLDFNAGTATIGGGFEPAIDIDGDLSDWDGIDALPSSQTSRIREWKFKSDSKNVYLMFKLRKNRAYKKPLVIGFDTDNNDETGASYDENKIVGLEALVEAYPFTNADSGVTPVVVSGVDASSSAKVGSDKTEGVVTVAGYDAGEDVSSDSSNTYIEISIPRSVLGLASGAISVGCAFDWYVTGKSSVTVE